MKEQAFVSSTRSFLLYSFRRPVFSRRSSDHSALAGRVFPRIEKGHKREWVLAFTTLKTHYYNSAYFQSCHIHNQTPVFYINIPRNQRGIRWFYVSAEKYYFLVRCAVHENAWQNSTSYVCPLRDELYGLLQALSAKKILRRMPHGCGQKNRRLQKLQDTGMPPAKRPPLLFFLRKFSLQPAI